MTVKPYGRVVLVLECWEAPDLPYPWIMRNCITIHGQWMYPPHAATLMVGLVRAGLIDLDHFEIAAFDLDHINDAVAHAAANSGPFRMTVVQPR